MTLPSSGSLALSQIQGEFTGSNPIGMSEYYRGGSLVPAIATTATIPSSGAIAVSNFRGTQSQRVSIPNNIGFAGSTDTQRYVGFAFGSDKIWRSKFGSGQPPSAVVASGTWCLVGLAGDYDILVESNVALSLAGGSLDINTWYNLGAGASFWYDGHNLTGFGASGVIRIRDKVSLIELNSQAFTFNWSA